MEIFIYYLHYYKNMILEKIVGHGRDVTNLDHDEVRRKIDSLDLGPIGFKLMNPDSGDGWSREKVERVMEVYKDFLYLSVTQSESMVPTKDVDSFWHTHILDTAKYAADCENTFGFFLHHFPYLGIRGGDDRQNLAIAFGRTKEIFMQELGKEYGASGETDCKDCGDCADTCGVGTSAYRPTMYSEN